MAKSKVSATLQPKVVTPKYFRITRITPYDQRHDGYCGKDKYVHFWDGVGVLDLDVIAVEQPGWIEKQGDLYVQLGGETLENYVAYWNRRNFRVEQITAEESAVERARVVEGQRAYNNSLIQRAKAKQNAKTAGKEGDADRLAEETKTVKAVADANAGVTTDAASEGQQAEKLPHEEGGAMVASGESQTTSVEEEKPATGGGGTNEE